MYLVFDTETTGLPVSWRAPASDVDNWPRLVQLAWAVFDLRGRRTLARSCLIRPDGFTIPRDAERVHGISTAIARRRGIPVARALGAFEEVLAGAPVLVAHNFKFDAGVLGTEFHRLGLGDRFGLKTRICTMEAGTAYCGLPGRYGFKWPRLRELHVALFEKEVREEHDAAADVATCAKCFFELKRLGIVRLPAASSRVSSRGWAGTYPPNRER